MNLETLVAALPELYQPVYGHEELSGGASRASGDRLAKLRQLHGAMTRQLGRRVRVLDLGCAQGFFSLNLASLGAIVRGVDFCAENVALCEFLAREQGFADASFECADLSTVVETLDAGEWDLVIGFSVFHHVIHTRGLEHACGLVRRLAEGVGAAVFEWALPVEPLYWAASLPASPWEMMRDFAFVHLLGTHSTHLSEHIRPLYFCSNRFWYFGGALGRFDRAGSTSGAVRSDTHAGSRRMFDGGDRVVKIFAKHPAERLQLNRREWENEVAYLSHPVTGMGAPELFEHGENEESFWLSRERYEGATLDELIRARAPYDKRRAADDLLAQLVRLEENGLFHNDVRTWNVVVRTEGGARLIDFGSISGERRDVAWPFDLILSLVITLNEIFRGEEGDIVPSRSPWITPEALPDDYASAFWRLLQENEAFPSYARFQALVRDYDGGSRTSSFGRLAETFEQAVLIQKRSLAIAEDRLAGEAEAHRDARERLDLLERRFDDAQAENERRLADLGHELAASQNTAADLATHLKSAHEARIPIEAELAESLRAHAESLRARTEAEVARAGAEAELEKLRHLRVEVESTRSTVAAELAELRQRGERAQAALAQADEQQRLGFLEQGERIEHLTRSLNAEWAEKETFRGEYERLLASASWRLTEPLRFLLRALRWLKRGALAWFALKPGSRPRRLARRGLNDAFTLVQRKPKLARAVSQVVGRVPTLHHRLRSRIDPLHALTSAMQSPPRSDGSDHVAGTAEVKLAHIRLAYASEHAGHADEAVIAHGTIKPRMAYVSPLPPDQSGIADYSAQILPFLSRYYTIDIVVQDEADVSRAIEGFVVRSVQWFEQNAHLFERVLYHFGNSPMHSRMFDLVEKIPGVVVLHDFFVGDILAYLELHQRWDGWWSRFMFQSHGYEGLSLRLRPELVRLAIHEYPANLPLLRQSQGIVVHNEFARMLCGRFYPAYEAGDWSVVPLAKALAPVSRSDQARQTLGFGVEDFVVCSFGFVQHNKLGHRLLDAWLASPLAADPRCHLVFVGDAPYDDYGIALRAGIASADLNDRIRITGFVAPDVYEHYLQAADTAVQLRTLSRGETSAAVLDCLAHGLPTIVNANGSMTELPDDVVMTLPDQFEDKELVAALAALRDDGARRVELGSAGRRHIAERHSPIDVAKQYRDAIEGFVRKAEAPDDLAKTIAYVRRNFGTETPASDDLLVHARQLRRVRPLARPARQMLIDVSALVRDDLRTGIQRVVRAQLVELLKSPPLGYRVQPVWLDNASGAWRYHYAHRYMAVLLDLPAFELREEEVEVGSGDVFYGADFFAHGAIAAVQAGIFGEWKAVGVRISFAVYDILPLTMPQYFPRIAEFVHRQWLRAIAGVADDLVCISHSVASEVRRWLETGPPVSTPGLRITACPLGADISASAPSNGLPENAERILAELRSSPTFLTVGTIEPRKGHLAIIEAMQQLWREGIDARLAIVGARGWSGVGRAESRNIPATIEAISGSPERNRRLFWFEKASDEFLEQIYAASSCLVAASFGEGFGLPLIEAARHGKPIVARDIPVFREVAGSHALYFDGSKNGGLAATMKRWLELNRSGQAPSSAGVEWLTWAQNVERLKQILIDPPKPAAGDAAAAVRGIDPAFFEKNGTVAPPVTPVGETLVATRAPGGA